MRLYELSAQFQDLQESAESGEDVSDKLAALGDAIEAKGAALVAVLRGLDAEAEAFKAEEKRLSDRRRAIENNATRIRDYIRGCMAGAGIEKIKCGTFSITLSDGPPSVQITDESKVPEAYIRTKREVNKTAVMNAWRELGVVVEGCDIVHGKQLRIR